MMRKVFRTQVKRERKSIQEKYGCPTTSIKTVMKSMDTAAMKDMAEAATRDITTTTAMEADTRRTMPRW
jgi:hypothetical protein